MLSHVIPVRSIEADDTDFSDLMPLADAIGDARVVGLGEARHGDGHAFKAKVRLAAFLHQVMGFDVLAWESGLFDCRELDRALKDDTAQRPPDGGIYAIWRQAVEVQPLFDLARTAPPGGRRLEMAGFDCRLSDRRFARYHTALFEFVDAVDPSLADDNLRARLRTLIEQVDCFDPPYDPRPEDRVAARAAVERLVERLLSNRRRFVEAHGEHALEFWHESLRGLLDLERVRALWPEVGGP